MSSAPNTVAWLSWAGAEALLVISTRNPLLLGLVLLETALVYLTGRTADSGGERAAWSTVLRIGAAVAGLSVLFNLLTAHVGDHVIVTVPGAVPIFGGPLTLNSLVYGAISGSAIISLLLVAACINEHVDRAALLRLVPDRFWGSGLAAIVALSFFPQVVQALGEVREAQAARGFRVRSPRDLNVLIVPVLYLGLERAFRLAETLESRGFGETRTAAPGSVWSIPAGLICALSGAVLLVMRYTLPGLAVVALGGGLIALSLRGAPGRRRGSLRPLTWDHLSLILLGCSILSMALTAFAIGARPGDLEWSPYPLLGWPALSLLPACAVLATAAPLVIMTVAP